MKWRATSKHHAISDCGRYHVSRADLADGPVYDAWFGTLAERTLRPLYTGPDREQAMQACVDDAANQPQQQRQSAA